MKKKFLFSTLFLLLVGCSTPDNETQDSGNNNLEDASNEEIETSSENEDNETENQSGSTTKNNTVTEESEDISSKNDGSEDNTSNDEIQSNDEVSKDKSDESADSTVENNDANDETKEKSDVNTESDHEVGNSRFIDVISQDFINVYFSSPDTYIPSELTLGMSQTEVENIYGKHETEYQLEGANLAIYGNVGILYSQSVPASELATHINPDENFINDVWIYINEPHSAILNTYGPPTIDFDDYQLYGPGDREMIYDGTRNNGYAVYIAVQNGTAMVMHKAEERDLDSFPYTSEER